MVTVELANGQKVTLDSIKKMQGDIENRASLVSAETQRFKGQVTSYAGMYIAIDDTFKDYFGVMKPEKNYPFRLYGEVAGAGRGYYFPPNKQGEVALQQFDDFRNKNINESGIYSYGITSGLVNAGQVWGGDSGSLGSITNNRVWHDKSGYVGNYQFYNIGDSLFHRGGSVGSDNYINKFRQIIKTNDYGVGHDALVLNRPSRILDIGRAGFYGYATPSDLPSGIAAYGSFIHVRYDNANASNLIFSNYGSIFLSIDRWTNNSIREKVDVMTSNMWTVDGNGFYKRSSPIININPDGTYTTNDESEGATVTRLSEGEYLIEGVLGFNADAGWGGVDGGIEIPLDVNKQPLIWVDSKILADGSIRVRTYHRTHPNAPKFARNDIEGYSDGDLIDIPDGRFISVRVQMPEQSLYNVRMREMEEAQKAEEERRGKEEEMKEQFGLGENDILL
ncbi:hypothetical protein [Proteus myxofaciens]|uniref:phage tail fiber protein n=1 Tax=Proteus myxofaciens TaxID=184072 RepID=UPI001428B0BA|nr:hypothetical protein [Proteus myxofaciens]